MDESLFKAINQGLADPTIDWVMATITSPESWLAPGVMLATALCLYGRKKGIVALAAAVFAVGAGDMLAHNVIKPMVGRHRPCAELPDVHQPSQVGCTDSFSFPSNHAVNSFSFAAVIGIIYPRMLIALAPIALLVALSRVAVGVHYPADVVAGAVLGVIIGVSTAALARRLAMTHWQEEALEDG
ncbi:MAG: phosphatase PAP2 family protein [Nitrospinota bacterium]|nr:phosphatase PAP2 family protein [Nitrospinota bacterium]